MRIPAFALMFLLLACHESSATHQSADRSTPPPPQAAAASAAATPAASTGGSIVVRDASGAEVANIRDSGGSVTINYTANGEKHVLQGAAKESGKRKYRTDGGGVMFEIKPGDDGFKLRTADGTLRWKVKVSTEKIKISDNEQNANPFELKIKDDGVKVVAPVDREMGKVKRDKEKGDIVVQDASGTAQFRIEGPASPGYGVLLLDSIPPPQRYMLLAELLAGGR
jgi:hypothetical protein